MAASSINDAGQTGYMHAANANSSILITIHKIQLHMN